VVMLDEDLLQPLRVRHRARDKQRLDEFFIAARDYTPTKVLCFKPEAEFSLAGH
jgi:hypothetical protein